MKEGNLMSTKRSIFWAIILIVAILVLPVLGASAKEEDSSAIPKSEVLSKVSKLHIPFIPNEGQMDERVKYYARSFGGTVFVTEVGEIFYSLPKREEEGKTLRGWVLKEELLGGRVRGVKGQEEAPTRVSYFIGNDASQWRSNISTYGSVSFGEVYEGIEVKLRAYGRSVEKLFYVRPGVEPGVIRLRLSGTESLGVNGEGELEMRTGLGEVKFSRPVAYQEVEGERRYVEVSYQVEGKEYGFKLGDYERGRELVIDPLLQSTYLGGSGGYLGGSGDDYAYSIAIDSGGNVFVAGWAWSSDFPGTAGGAQPSQSQSPDAFVSKLNPTLTTLLQSTYLGGSDMDYAYSIAIDSGGNVYVAGWTFSYDFPGTTGGAQPSNSGNTDAFVTKLNSTLTTIVQSTYLGGSYGDYAQSIAIDSGGNVYVTGYTGSADFPGATGGAHPSNGGGSDAFVTKFNSTLTSIVQSTYLGGSLSEYASSIAVDSGGNIYVAGYTYSTNFPGTAGGAQPSNSGNTDAFVTKLNSTLTTIVQSTYLGGSYGDYAQSIAIDSGGNVFVAGDTQSSNFPGTTGGAQFSRGGGYDAFVTKLNPTLTTIIQSTCLGGSLDDSAFCIAIDSGGNVYVAGWTDSTDFPGTTGGAQPSNGGGTNDAFVSKLNPTLTSVVQSTYLGGNDWDQAFSIAIDPGGNVYAAGQTSSTNFPGTVGGAQPSLADGNYNYYFDAFVARFDSLAAVPVAAALVSPSGTIADTTPTYTWYAVPTSTWYCLYVNDSSGNKINQWYAASDAGCPDGIGTCSVTPTTEVIGSCQWWVRTYNGAGYGPWSAPLQFTTPIPHPPPTPTLISPSGEIADTTPTYIWYAVLTSTWYCLYVNDSTGNKIQQWHSAEACGCPSGTGTCSVSPTTEVIGSCQWYIQAYNPAGFGPWSAPLSFTTPIPPTPPVAATPVSPSGTITDTTPTYTWNPVSNATWYCLYVNDSSGNKISQWYAASDAGCPDGIGTCSVTPTTEVIGSCQWWIRTYNSAGYGPWSTPLTFTVPPPSAATLVSPSGTIADTTPTYTWNAVSDATWYQLYVNGSTGKKIQQWYMADACGCASGTGTCSVTPTIEVISSCQWYIQTYNPAGFGSWSAPLSFTTPIPPPPIAAAQISPSGETSDNTPTYTWDPVSNATWYCLYVNDSTGNKINQWYAASDAGCPDGTGTCYVTPSIALVPGAGQWWIRTYNSRGYGPWSLPGKNFMILAQSLYDDFSAPDIDKNKWRQGELVREIRGGELVSKATAYSSRVINNLDFKNPASITYLEADVTIDQIEDLDPDDPPKYSLPNARLTGFFYNDGTASGEGSHKGEVQAVIRIALYRGELKAQWAVEKSLDDEATQWWTLGSAFFPGTISLNIPYKLSIQFEPSLKRFTFKLGTSTSTWTSTDTINPSNTPWKAIGTDVSFFPTTPSSIYGKVSAIFDNLIAKDESGVVLVNDDFSSPTIDPTKWATYELVREISGEKLRSEVRSGSATTSPVYNDLEFLYPSTIDFIQVKVTPVTYQNSQGAQPVAGIAGIYYNDGTGTGIPGDHTGDVGAQVLIGGAGVNPAALWMVSRSTDSSGQVPATVASGTFATPISLGNTYTVALEWDGSRFTFRIGSEEATYTPATAVNPPNIPWKAIGTCIWDPAGKEAAIEALFDDVMLYYGPPGAATLVSPFGEIDDPTPTYIWNAVSGATWYRLWVNDATGNRIQKWYTASEVGCASGIATCSVTPTTDVGGSCQWWVQTYNSAGFGPWSDPLSFTVPPPPAATLVSPFGDINDPTPTYIWNAVSAATWYRLWVNEATVNRIQKWYTASEAGCASGTGTCSVTPTTGVGGSCRWWVQTYNSAGFGPWSDPLSFTVPRPDLIETSVTNPPQTGKGGATFSVTDTVRNQGNVDAGPSITRYYLSVDSVRGSDILLTGTRSVPGLTAGETSTGTVNVTILSGTAAGIYYLLACADDMESVFESNEANNCKASSTRVQVTAPDLVETFITNPPPLKKVGTTFPVTDTVKNQGNADAGPSVTRYYLSVDSVRGDEDILLTETRSVPGLAAGATSMDTVTVTIPSSTASQAYHLLACSDDTGSVAENDDTNNCIASSGTVQVIP
jgi:hypothetical protein